LNRQVIIYLCVCQSGDETSRSGCHKNGARWYQALNLWRQLITSQQGGYPARITLPCLFFVLFFPTISFRSSFERLFSGTSEYCVLLLGPDITSSRRYGLTPSVAVASMFSKERRPVSVMAPSDVVYEELLQTENPPIRSPSRKPSTLNAHRLRIFAP
jgi:hypothetical protein